ncbi:uncharacterized protein [Maniola hyperantus]|uniref:uncharacterized protein isoform X2 n=1 Tax=Aphantopus hyperantus TaxID=2795564 RepID=UPI00374A8584
MDSERRDVSHRPRKSSKRRLWPSVPRKRRWTKKFKENTRPKGSKQHTENSNATSVPPRREGILIESIMNEQKASRSSSLEPGGIEITTTAEINVPASVEPVIDLESEQFMNIEQINQSFSRNLTPTSTTTTESLIVEKENNEVIEVPKLNGRRLIDVAYLFEQLSSIDHSPFNCTFKDFKFVSENRQGMYACFKFDCQMCGEKVIIKSDRSGREINQHVVHGIVTSGNGFAQLDEFCAHVDMPCMSDKLFIKENIIFGDIIKDIALESMYQAGKEEREIAIAKGHVDPDGIPYITVVVDGSWAKRSYRTNYNSLSGVSCIIGFETKKVLFLGIRNAYCCVCALAKNKNTVPKEHRCFKNWSKSSTAMEADGIVEGFKCSIDMHKIKYKTLIGDGDSSVTSALNESLPYGHCTSINKIECSNHLLRNYCSKLKNLTKKTENKFGLVPVRLRKTLDLNILRLRKAIKGAVDHTSKLPNVTKEQKLNNLKQDLLNSPCHVFGDHEKCKPYFCKGVIGENFVPEMKKCGLWYDLFAALSLIVTNVESLLMAQTNNIAEQFNSIIAKFIGGKRVNYCLRGSYEMRCYAAAAKQNTGNLVKTLANATEIPMKYLKRNECKNKRTADTSRITKRRKRNVALADEHYGNMEKEADLESDIFNKKKEEFLLDLTQSASNRNKIQTKTIGQGANQEWLKERKIRLTASFFGQVCKLRPATSCKNVVKQLLYNKFKGNDATKYGSENEPVAVKDAEKVLGLQIEPCGLFIDEKRPYLGASPDGLVGDDTIVEIKCPSSASNLSPVEAIDQKKITFCTNDSNLDNIKLKRNHNYYYQIQGQLQITQRKYCIFIVWTPLGLVYEKIEKNNDFWNSIVSKLDEFYFKCILPELIDPRLPRNLPIRDR